MRIGLLGGTFDPVHKGHIHLAEEAIRTLKLDKTLFIPTSCSPFKTDQEITDSSHRLKMVRLAIAGKKQIEISEIEIFQNQVSYTIDTVKKIKALFPENTEFFLLMGTDAYSEINLWRDPEALKKNCKIAVVARSDYKAGEAGDAIVVSLKTVPYSATEIRKALSESKRPEGLCDEVFDYIKSNQLYGFKK